MRQSCAEVMTQVLACCFPTSTLEQAAQLMRSEDVGALPVVASKEDSTLVGIITDRDIALQVAEEESDPRTIQVEEVMSADPVTCHEDDDVEVAMQAMAEHKIRRIPVVSDQGEVVGIIAQADVAVRVHEPKKTAEVVEQVSKPNGKHI